MNRIKEYQGVMTEANYELLSAIQTLCNIESKCVRGHLSADAINDAIQEIAFPNNSIGKKALSLSIMDADSIRNNDTGRGLLTLIVPSSANSAGPLDASLQMRISDSDGEVIAESGRVGISEFAGIPQELWMETIAEDYVCRYDISTDNDSLRSDVRSMMNIAEEFGFSCFKIRRKVFLVKPNTERDKVDYIELSAKDGGAMLGSLAEKITELNSMDEQAQLSKELRTLYAVLNIWVNQHHALGEAGISDRKTRSLYTTREKQIIKF